MDASTVFRCKTYYARIKGWYIGFKVAQMENKKEGIAKNCKVELPSSVSG